jgi:hypothetical protein
MKRIAIVLLAVAAAACRSPKAPTPLACETNNTGTIRFGNRSPESSGRAYDIVWDGVRIFEKVAAGATSDPKEEAAGVAHTLTFRVSAGFSGIGCTGGTPILIRCQSQTITCAQ